MYTCSQHSDVTSGRAYGAGMSVLVVEDDARTASMLRRGLSEDGYSVDVIGDGAEALWHAGEVDYDAILLDLMLPGMDGLEVCRRLRQAPRWAPVLMLTARAGIDDRVRGLDTGADDYLARPVCLTVADLKLDAATRQAWRGDAELELSGKEFALLELFLRRAGEVLSRTVITEHVWDFAYEGVSNIVDQHVASLRRKIDRPFGLDQLETVRGAGYRLRREPMTGSAPRPEQSAP